ncbi:hypothetical protein [Henriciella sp.]|uniref:hypothetical protein n=1 Tax=Henriciella sp. TaxID=1968823 RepID=UPI00260DC390|nr:hypothetical protein [Henriciella sp.]
MRLSVIAVLAVVTCWLAGAAHAQDGVNVNTANQQSLLNIAQSAGHSAQPSNIGGDGVPGIEVRTQDGITFYAVGTACEQGGCRGIKLMARHQPAGTVSYGKINTINREMSPLKLWYTPEVVILERYLILDGGVSPAHLAFEMRIFPTYVSLVTEQLNQAEGSSQAQ